MDDDGDDDSTDFVISWRKLITSQKTIVELCGLASRLHHLAVAEDLALWSCLDAKEKKGITLGPMGLDCSNCFLNSF